MSHKGQTKSVVWKFFMVNEDDATKVTCKLCNKMLSRGNKNDKKCFTTTNMYKHLKSQHQTELEQEEELQKEEKAKKAKKRTMSDFVTSNIKKHKFECHSSTSSSSHSQITLEETLKLTKKWDINSEEAKKIHVAIGEMMALDVQPFSIVEDLGFRKLMKLLKPNYELPSRKYFTATIIPNLHVQVMNKVHSKIDKATNMSFTTDIWTNNADTSFISLTANCIDENFNTSMVVLRVKPFPDSHTASNICEIVQDVVDEYKIPPYKVHMIVHDNAANMVKGIANTGFNSLTCFLHTCQLVVMDAIFEQRIMKDVIASCRQITGHFNHSPSAYAKLEALQTQHNLPKHKLIQDVSTRWNSTYLMLDRIFEQKTAIANYCADVPNLPVFDANKWVIIGKCSKLLKIFHETTLRLSGRSANSSEIIPQVRVLKHTITKIMSDQRFFGLGSTLAALSRSLESRFAKYEDNEMLIAATILDPRYKNSLFKSSEEGCKTHLLSIQGFLTNALKTMQHDIAIHEENVTSASDIKPELETLSVQAAEEATVNIYDFDSCLEDLIASTESNVTKEQGGKKKLHRQISASKTSEKMTNELKNYCALQLEATDADPMQWWRANKDLFPELARLAAKMLSSPPSSIESERLFSIGGNVYSPHRNRLTSEIGEKLMLLNYSLHIFNCEY